MNRENGRYNKYHEFIAIIIFTLQVCFYIKYVIVMQELVSGLKSEK